MKYAYWIEGGDLNIWKTSLKALEVDWELLQGEVRGLDDDER